MPTPSFQDLLTQIHRSIDQVAADLARDQPRLAEALRRRSEWIPRPEDLLRGSGGAGASACRTLHPLLYEALDEGVLDERQFDTLMLHQAKARRTLCDEQDARDHRTCSVGSPSDS